MTLEEEQRLRLSLSIISGRKDQLSSEEIKQLYGLPPDAQQVPANGDHRLAAEILVAHAIKWWRN